MNKYPIKLPDKDFRFLENFSNIKGTRVKRFVMDKYGKKAKGYFVKYLLK